LAKAYIYNLQTVNEPELNIHIQRLRAQLDKVDGEIVQALNKRARLVHKLAALKREAGVPLYDPKREEEILRRVAKENPGPTALVIMVDPVCRTRSTRRNVEHPLGID
jgi:chorismate mutase